MSELWDDTAGELRRAERLEEELGEERQIFFDEAALAVGLDSSYLHNYEQKRRQDDWFEVIVGKSVLAQGTAKRFVVHAYDDKPKRRLFEILKSQGMDPNQLMTFLSDGSETVRNLPVYLNPQATHLLDWFHISLWLTVIGQTAKGVGGVERPPLISQVANELESLKWQLWNGDGRPALGIIEGLRSYWLVTISLRLALSCSRNLGAISPATRTASLITATAFATTRRSPPRLWNP